MKQKARGAKRFWGQLSKGKAERQEERVGRWIEGMEVE